MQFSDDEGFRQERMLYSLRFCCEDCAIFDVLNERCAHGFPTAEHRRARYEAPAQTLAFCKEFEAE